MKMLGTRNKLFTTAVTAVALFTAVSGCASGNTATDNKAAAANTSAPSASTAATAAPKVNFPTKDITYIVPVPPGGGIDTYSRIIARGLEKYLPNNPKVIVKNVPGGDFTMGINEVYNAKADGHTIGTFLSGNVLNQVLGKANYDIFKMSWIGNIGFTPMFGAVSAKSPYKTFKDLQNSPKKVSFGLPGGFSAHPSIGAIIATKEMGLKLDFVPHKGTAETVVATQRGDLDFNISTYVALQGALQSKDLVPLIAFADQRFPKLPDVPTAAELGYPDMAKIFLTYYHVGTTPGVSKEVNAILSEALKKAVEDPEISAELTKANATPAYTTPEETVKIFKFFADTYEKNKPLLQEYIK
jgi:tripartite-type tricarboxylate transporter receptor subunit TctC